MIQKTTCSTRGGVNIDFTEKLDLLMAQRHITRGRLAAETGIPYNTIVGFYTKGYKNAKISNVRRIASYFGVSMDDLCDDGRPLPTKEETTLTEIGEKYSALSEKGRRIVDELVRGLADMEAPEEHP